MTDPNDDPRTDKEALRSRLRDAEMEIQRAQNAAYYAHRSLLETNSPPAAANYRQALVRCQRAADALALADEALRGAHLSPQERAS